MPAAKQASPGMQSSRRCLCRRHQSRNGRLVHIQPLRLMVRRNVGLSGSPAAVALPHQGGTLAQLALMRIAWTAKGQAVHGICMPSGTGNTASEAGVNKLFTTAWPLQIFVQLVAAWAYKHKWSVLASHIPGEHNVWADQLSRGNTPAFDSKPQARFRFRPHDFWPHKCMLSLHPPDTPRRPL